MSGKKEVVHPLTKQVYRLTEEGLVEVYDPATEERGLFDHHGEWQSGTIRHADIQIAGWVGRLAQRRPLPPEDE